MIRGKRSARYRDCALARQVLLFGNLVLRVISRFPRGKVGPAFRDGLKTWEELEIVAPSCFVSVLVTLTPALSQGEREACGVAFRSPLPEGEG